MATYNEKVLSGIDPDLEQAIRVIKNQYGYDVSVNKKAKNLLKFDRNTAVGNNTGGYTLMGLLYDCKNPPLKTPFFNQAEDSKKESKNKQLQFDLFT